MEERQLERMDVPPTPTVIPRRPALHGAADFVSWTWEMVNAGYPDIGWSADGSRILVKKPERLASLVLPQFFRHSQYASWVRALNAYHFKKVSTGQWSHACFHRDKPELLKKIVRKGRETATRPVPSSSTALDLRQVSAILVEERSRLRWLKQEMRRLESEVQEAEGEELRQRWEAVALTQYIFEQMKPRDAQEPLLGGSGQEPAITMLSSLSSSTAAEEHAAHMRLGCTTIAPSGAARGGSGAPPCPEPPFASRISSRDLAQLELSEIDLLSQSIDLRALQLERNLSSPSSPASPAAPLPSLRLAPSIPPHAAQPPRASRDGLSSHSLSVLSTGSGSGAVMRQHPHCFEEEVPVAAGSAASGLQKAAVDYYFNQLSLIAEHGLHGLSHVQGQHPHE